MAVAWGQINAAGQQRLPILRFRAGHATEAGQMFGQDGGESGGHVLGEHHRHRNGFPEALDEGEQGLRAAG